MAVQGRKVAAGFRISGRRPPQNAETLVKRLITKITVFEDHFTIDFKSGVTIEINA